ncbi:MAG: hypothetical protein ACUVQ8_02220 [Nitrososphaeria archaeon]
MRVTVLSTSFFTLDSSNLEKFAAIPYAMTSWVIIKEIAVKRMMVNVF